MAHMGHCKRRAGELPMARGGESAFAQTPKRQDRLVARPGGPTLGLEEPCPLFSLDSIYPLQSRIGRCSPFCSPGPSGARTDHRGSRSSHFPYSTGSSGQPQASFQFQDVSIDLPSGNLTQVQLAFAGTALSIPALNVDLQGAAGTLALKVPLRIEAASPGPGYSLDARGDELSAQLTFTSIGTNPLPGSMTSAELGSLVQALISSDHRTQIGKAALIPLASGNRSLSPHRPSVSNRPSSSFRTRTRRCGPS